jgi:L-asparagine transporter-like permease
MRDKDPSKMKSRLESLILYECYLILASLGLLLFVMIFNAARGAYFFAAILFFALVLLVMNLIRYRKILDLIPSERVKSVLLSLKQGLWD